LRQDRFNPGHIAAQQAHPARLFELTALLLQPEMEAFLAQVALLGQELVRAHFLDFFELHFR
jgi:hypothetical protein